MRLHVKWYVNKRKGQYNEQTLVKIFTLITSTELEVRCCKWGLPNNTKHFLVYNARFDN